MTEETVQFVPIDIADALQLAKQGKLPDEVNPNTFEGLIVDALHAAVDIFPKPTGVRSSITRFQTDFRDTQRVPAVSETDPENTKDDALILRGRLQYMQRPGEDPTLTGVRVMAMGVFPHQVLDKRVVPLGGLQSTSYDRRAPRAVSAIGPNSKKLYVPENIQQSVKRVLYVVNNLPKRAS